MEAEMNYPIAIVIGLPLAMLLAVSGCGETSDEAYERGFDDGFDEGWADTCNRIDRFSERMGQELKEQNIC